MPSEQILDKRIASLHDTMAGYVERGETPGIVTLISQGHPFSQTRWRFQS